MPADASGLLIERLKLAVHSEARNIALTQLVVAKGGPKAGLARVRESDTEKRVLVNGARPAGSDNGWSMDQLAEFLRRFSLGRVLVNRTGSPGHIASRWIFR